MKFNRISIFAVSAVTLLSTLAMAAPASAATCPLTSTGTRYVYTYRAADWATLLNWLSARMPVAQAAPAPAVKAPAPQTTQASTLSAPAAKAPAPAATAPATSGLTAEEQQMLNLVNGERTKLGLPAYKADLELTKLARMKSQDMINRNYFSHQSPTYGSPFDMMAKYGVTYKTAGENIAGNGSVSGAHTSLMNSPGHRANILNTGFNTIGIGIVHGGQYGMMFTQMFVGR
ncbi:MAG TPA: CAP domain-containing protein [Symbiobacteriaceae bacterium]|nr:CAP domain-containing protein [Symbiobacteriaceae bacterium]